MKQEEIKFKVWDKKNKIMEGPESWFLISQTGRIYYHGPMKPLRPVPEGQYIPLFYIGIKDKNGKEIYRGDLIKIKKESGWIFEVYWNKELLSFEAKSSQNKGTKVGGTTLGDYIVPMLYEEDLEIIGNIYETNRRRS